MLTARRTGGIGQRQRRIGGAVLVMLAVILGSGCWRMHSQAREFDGRWNIKAEDNTRVAWLDLRLTETDRPHGLFVVGTPKRSAGTYANLVYTVSAGVLRFEVPADREQSPRLKETYTARIADGKLLGQCFPVGGGRILRWVGERPPAIEDRDDGSWVSASPRRFVRGTGSCGVERDVR
jgi:hypothetical protein